MNSRRPRIIKTTAKAASGGVLAVIALIALMFFRGAGTGTDEGNHNSESEQASTQRPMASATTETAVEATDLPDVSDGDDSGLTSDEQQALSGKTLGILIDEWNYLLEVPGDPDTIFRPAELERLLVLAAKAEGDTNGIRIRILQRETARPKAEQELRQKLADIGISASAIYMPAEFIP